MLRVTLAALVLLASLPLRAHAQDDMGTERARELFTEGIGLAEESNFSEAALRFREAYALVPSPNIAYNLAVALVELGEITEASALVETVLTDEEADEGIRQLATGLRERIAGRAAHLRISLSGPRGDAEVHLDDRTLGEEALGTSIEVDPGAHVVLAERQGTILERQEVTAEAGQNVDVTLDPSTWPGNEPPPPPPSESIFGKWWFWAIVGGAVLVVGAGVAIGIAAASGPEGPLDGNTSPTVLRF